MRSRTPSGGLSDAQGAFLLALAVTFGVILLDLLLGGRVILVELLVAGPLIAATRATVIETAIVAALALAASIPLGLASGAFFEAAHVSGVVAVAIGGALAVVIARLRSGGEKDSARLRVQYGVARVLAESDSAEEAGPRLLEAIAAPLGWRAGHLWEPDGGEHLTCTAAWVGQGSDLSEFERATHALRAAPGRGLPGRVWQSRRPAWVSDLSSDQNFLRREGAAAGNLRCGMAFPVLSGERPLAVIEVFSHEHRELDRPLVALTEALGAQIGDFFERVRATRAVRESEDRARESRDQLEAMLRGVADAVTVQAPDGRLLFVNDAAVSTLGFDSTAALLDAAPAEILAGFRDLRSRWPAVPGLRSPRAPRARRRGGRGGRGALSGEGHRRGTLGRTSRPIRCGTAGATVSMAINVIEDISAHKRAELAQAFLARTSEVLSHWVGTDEVLEQVAGLVVPEVADWCAVDLVTDAGELERLVLAHAEPERREARSRAEPSLPTRPRVLRRLPRHAQRPARALPRDHRADAAGQLP